MPREMPGYDVRPDRPSWASAVLLMVVVALASATAYLFRESAFWAMEQIGDTSDATGVADDLRWPVTFALVFATVLLAAWIGGFALRRWPSRCGLEAIAATAAGEERNISLRATGLRSAATWVMSAGLVPIGREAAIIEAGGAIGSGLGRRFRGHGAAMATAGIAAAFATAYHAPLAAMVYVEEHLRVRASRRATVFALAGALGGFLLAVVVFDVRVVLPAVEASWRDQAVAVCIVALPAALAARVFVEGRTRLSAGRAARVTSARCRVLTAIGGAGIAAGVVVRYPFTAGNGMDVLREVSTAADVAGALVVAMVLAKMTGALATFGSGAPGGALTPTIVVGGGAGLAATMLAERLGWGTPGVWTIVVLGGAAAIAVGLRAPLTAIVLLPELTGRYALVPACGAVVLLAVAIDRSLDAAERRWGGRVPVGVHDEDG